MPMFAFKFWTFTLDFSSLLKNHFECLFVSSECSLQSSNVVLKFVPTICDEPALQVLIGCHNKSASQIAKQALELCKEHSKLTNEHLK